MPISYVGGSARIFINNGATSTASLTSLSGGSDTAPSAGDLVIVSHGVASSSTAETLGINSPGYTSLSQLTADSIRISQFRVHYKVMGATPDTEVVVTQADDNTAAKVVSVQVFRGADEATPLDVSAVSATSSNSVLVNPSPITPTTSGAWIVAVGVGAHVEGTNTFSSSDLSNFITAGVSDKKDITIGAGTAEWSSGAFDPAQFTFSDTSKTDYSWAAYTLALRPKPSTVKAIRLGSNTPAAIFLGANSVQAVWLGSNQIWGAL